MRLALLGLGLIGGSVGLALRAARPDLDVVGWDRDPASVELAARRGAVCRGFPDLAEAVEGADVVMLATPVGAFPDLFKSLRALLRPGTLVTDVASTKSAAVGWAREAGLNYVGGHPMAGTEQVGMAHADGGMFRGARWFVTPEPGADPESVERVEELARAVGAHPMRLDAREHDAFMASVSHLPFVASAALVALTTADPRWADMAPFAATGYRDATRLASGSAAMYRDICTTNREAIAPLLKGLAARLMAIADQLDDPRALEEFFTGARDAREAWLAAHSRFR